MREISKSFFKAEPGQIVNSGGASYRITHIVSVDSVLAIHLETQQTVRLRVETISLGLDAKQPIAEESKDLALYSEEEWGQAQRRFQAIKPLLENPIRTRESTEKIAQKHRVHAATLYKWLKQYQQVGDVSALVPTKRGRKSGTRLLTDEQERVIESVIDDVYLTKQRNKAQDVIEEVLRRCRLTKIVPPHPNTVRNRLKILVPKETLRRRGLKALARDRYAAIQAPFPGADHPLAVVQIDHTEADIILVDEAHRKPIGRPWLTLAIDVYSRMIVGLYVSFERPNAASVGMCLAQAICPKREYLAELGVGGEWAVWGVMSTVHTDNAKEFRGAVLERGCEKYGINLQWRPVMLPHFGGHIERLMGTMANENRKLPGATFSNPAQRKGYNSEAEASLTLKEYERHLVEFIVNVYQQRVHSQLGVSPRRKWELGVLGDESTGGTGVMPIPQAPLRVRLDFMPYFERSVQQYGIKIDGISYYDKAIDRYINAVDPSDPKRKRIFLVRRDPRDISTVYFFNPDDDQYIPLAYRNVGFPAMSAWELKEVQRALKIEGRRDVDEQMIFDALDRMRARIEDAKHKTKTARRQATRIPAQQKTSRPIPETRSKTLAIPSDADAEIEDPFAESIRTFDERSISR